jgi:desulfoferrodoxin (superoxide reductase-like protein)
MIKILSKPESLVNELYEIMDMVGNIPHPMADDVYSYINQLIMAVVVDDE